MIRRAIKFFGFSYRSIFNSNKSISTDLADWSNGGYPRYRLYRLQNFQSRLFPYLGDQIHFRVL